MMFYEADKNNKYKSHQWGVLAHHVLLRVHTVTFPPFTRKESSQQNAIPDVLIFPKLLKTESPDSGGYYQFTPEYSEV